MTPTDLKQIEDLLDKKLEQKLEQKLNEKLDEKLAIFVTKNEFNKQIEWLAAIIQQQFTYIDKNKVDRSELVSWVFN